VNLLLCGIFYFWEESWVRDSKSAANAWEQIDGTKKRSTLGVMLRRWV
jgi:uncharacterized membrane protein